MKVLHRALRQVLPLGNGLGLCVALSQDAVNASLAQFNGQAKADGAATDDHDIGLKRIVRVICHTKRL